MRNINNKNNKNMKTLKFTQSNILKMNNKTYLPYQLHQLPKWFNKEITDFVSLKGYTYINLNNHYDSNPYFDYEKFKDTLSYNRDLSYKQKR